MSASSTNYVVLPSYLPIRDDSGYVSLSTNEREFITQHCSYGTSTSANNNNNDYRVRHPLRIDGRAANQIRPIQIHLTRGDNLSTCTVQWGKGTRVSCTVYADLVPPLENRPSEGSVVITVDISPAASTAFRQAAPSTTGGGGTSTSVNNLPNADRYQKLQSNRIVRCLERMIIQGGVLDQEALCVAVGQWVWKLYISITVLDSGGNLLDASVMASMASLRHYRKPIVLQQQQLQQPQQHQREQEEDTIMMSNTPSKFVTTVSILSPNVKEPTPLPLHHTPLSVSFVLVPSWDNNSNNTTVSQLSSSRKRSVVALMDPNSREELCCANAIATVGLNVHGEICLFEYTGGSAGVQIDPTQIRELYNSAKQSTVALFASFEQTLQQADEQAFQDRLKALQQQQQSKVQLPPPAVAVPSGIPYFQSAYPMTDDFMIVDDNNENNNNNNPAKLEATIVKAQTDAEEAYRRQALDYNVGHIATKIRENIPAKNEQQKNNNTNISNQNRTSTVSTTPGSASSLLAAMLMSVSATTPISETMVVGATKNAVTDLTPNKVKDNPPSPKISETKSTILKKDIAVVQEVTSSVQKNQRSNGIGVDDDEEEDVQMEYKSEFDTVTLPKRVIASGQGNPKMEHEQNETILLQTKEEKMKDNNDIDDDDDIDDLAAAIKTKSNKKKTKNK